ncbi:SMP-30/gluconolactonase/LRE family protein [Halobacillus sp. A1]|uniref:SMP-30/gluconolactonase/LRE family protein n=1 Tax=Halobacillus sp. A1 TaxID=2880262 RepID=UPI0020A63391|nr:SMP-30/gluconolactonase/LRE family protein [Halobacillus sp. A1]MCP3031873.1 SMP-30/gluconolactonase/LRE family protein [Halobacillus sp. A1]
MYVELVVNSQATLGEGPCWDRHEDVLYWVDILEKKIGKYVPETREIEYIQLDSYVGAVAPREQGGLVVALQKGFYYLDWEKESLQPIADPENHLPMNRFNDGKCDPAGRFWAGTMDLAEESTTGALYCLQKDLKVEKKIDNVGISNGLAWSPDQRFMYFIDTPTGKVFQYEYEINTGKITNPEVAVQFPEGIGHPDGMTIDEEGMLWIAHFAGHGVSRWNPHTGEQLDFIEIPAVNVTSCTFGGENLDELYVTTARKGMSEEDLEEYPQAGGVFKVKTGIKGSPCYRFKG